MINALQRLVLSPLPPAQPTASSPSAEPAVAEVFNSRDVMEVVLAHAVRADAGSAAAGTQDARFVAWTKLRQVNTTTRAAAEGQEVVGALLGARPQTDLPHHAALSANRLRRNLALGRCRKSTLAGPAALFSVAYSPDSMHLASGTADDTLRRWDLRGTSPTATVLTEHSDWVRSVAFSPDGMHLASGSSDHTLRLWDLSGTSPTASVLTGHTDSVTSVAFSPDGMHLASGSNDNTLRLWDLSGTSPTASVLTGHSNWVRSVAFSPDGRHLASGSSNGTLRLWDLSGTSPTASVLTGHTDWVTSVAFSPDGRHLASGSNDHTLRLWNFDPGPVPSVA